MLFVNLAVRVNIYLIINIELLVTNAVKRKIVINTV